MPASVMGSRTCKRAYARWVVMWISHQLWMRERRSLHGYRDTRVSKSIESKISFGLNHRILSLKNRRSKVFVAQFVKEENIHIYFYKVKSQLKPHIWGVEKIIRLYLAETCVL